MDKKKLNLAIGAALIIVAGFLAITMFQGQAQPPAQLQQARESAPPPPPEYTNIILARKDIPKGSLIGQDMIKEKRVLVQQVGPNDYQSSEEVVGKVATVDILVGEPVNRSRVMIKPQEQKLSDRVPMGKRALTIPIDKIASLEGMIKPNDRVDILGTFPFAEKQTVVVPMFEAIPILAVGRTMVAYASEGKYESITLALEPKQASILVYALQLGQLRMLLRAQGDEQKVKVKEPVTMETLWMTLFNVQQQQMATSQQQQPAAQEPAPVTREEPKQEEIQVFSGGQRR